MVRPFPYKGMKTMSVNLGTAEGYIDLNLDDLRKHVTSAVKELQKIDKQGDLVQSQFREMESASKKTSGAFSQAESDAKKLSKELENAQDKAKAYSKTIDALKGVIAKATSEQSALSRQIQDGKSKLASAEEKVKDLSSAYNAAQKEIQKVTKEYGENSQECEQVKIKHQEIINAYEKAAKKSDEYRNALNQQEAKYKDLSLEIENSERKITDYQTALNNTRAKINDISKSLSDARNKFLIFGDSLSGLGSKIETIGDKTDDLGNKITLGITTPLAAIGAAALNAGNDFEAQMSRVSAIAGAYGRDLEKLRDQAVDLGAETSFSATESAQAMENLASAGFGVDEIMAAMPGMLDLAASSGEDLASSADIAASTLRGFGLEASEAGHVADVLAKNAADTNAAISDTGYAMKYIAPVAHSAGWSLEEVAAAIGVLADSGIKGEQAGTTLRGALVRLMKPTEEMEKTMGKLGLAFYDSEGKMKPLSTIIDDLQKATKGLTDEQRDNALATIFGTESLSGMKILLASSKKELDTLTKGLENADGAAEKMADTMLDNTKGSIEEMNGSLETAGITIQKQLAPWITKGAKKVTELANKFADLDEETQGTILSIAGIAAASGPVLKIGGKITSGIGKVTKGLGTLTKALGKNSGLSKGLDTATSSGSSFIGGVLSAIPTPAKIAVGAIAAIGTGAIIAFQQAKQAAIEADLESHFGDIELSAEEVEDVVERLTTTEWTVKVESYIEENKKLNEYESELKDTVSELNKLSWKVDLGLELTEDEKNNYISSVKDFISQSKDYLQQQEYTVSLALKASFKAGSGNYLGLSTFTEGYYNELYGELDALGSELAELVNESFANGTLDVNQEQIDEIIANMNEITSKIEQNKFEVGLSEIAFDASEAELTPESFQAVIAKVNEGRTELQESIDSQKTTVLERINIRYQEMIDEGMSKEFSDRVRKEAENALKIDLSGMDAEGLLSGFDTLMGKIQTAYDSELSSSMKGFKDTFQATFSEELATVETSEDWDALFANMQSYFNKGCDGLSDEAKANISSLLQQMKPQADELEEIARTYRESGEEVPKNISDGLNSYYWMQAMVGNTEGLFKIMGQQVGDNPKYLESLMNWQTYGGDLGGSMAFGIGMSSDKIYDATTKTWKTITAATDVTLPEVLEELNENGLKPGSVVADSFAAQYGLVYDSAKGMWIQVKDATLENEEDVKNALSTCGIDASDELIKSINSKKGDAKAEAIDLLHQLITATDEKKFEVLQKLYDLGIEVDGSLGDGLFDNYDYIASNTKGMIDVIDTTSGEKITEITPDFAKNLKKMGAKGLDDLDALIKNMNVSSPGVEDMSSTEAKGWRDNAQTKFDKFPLMARITVDKLPDGVYGPTQIHFNADGGIIKRQTLSWLAEGDNPEAVIPLSEEKRTRGLELWQQAGEMLGAQEEAYQFLSPQKKRSTGSYGIDYDLLAQKLASELRKSPLEVKPEIHVQAGDVYYDTERVGRVLAPTIDANLGTIQQRRNRGG